MADPALFGFAGSSLRRRKNFVAKAVHVPKRMDPEPGEFSLQVTYNGFQTHALAFTPEEWHVVREAVERFLARRARSRKEA
jgi:hypothetical protein